MNRTSSPPDPAGLLSEEEMPLRAGDEIDGFTITSIAAAGVMEVTYRARDTAGREAALVCVLGLDALSDEEIANEARTLGGLAGDHVVGLRAARRLADGFLLLVTDVPAGEPLRDRMEGGPLAPLEAVRIGIGAARALAEGHRLGVLHRDLTPDNVLVTPGGGVQLAAFGVAALRRPGPARSLGKRYGTPEYAAPEQFAGTYPTGPWSDLYSLGVVLYEALTGRHPLAKGPGPGELPAPEGMGAAHALWTPPPMESLLPELASLRELRGVIARGLAKHPEERSWGPRRGLLLPPDRQDLLALDFAAALESLLPQLETASQGRPAGPRGTQLLAPGAPSGPAATNGPPPAVPPARSSVKTAVFNSGGAAEGAALSPAPAPRGSVKTAVFSPGGKLEGAGQPPPAVTSEPAGQAPPPRSPVKTAVFKPGAPVDAGPPSAPRPEMKTAALPPAGPETPAGDGAPRRKPPQTAVLHQGRQAPAAAPSRPREPQKPARPLPYPDELRTGDPDDDRAAAGWVRATREMTRGGHDFERDGLLTSLRLHPHPAVRAVCAEELGRLGDSKCIPDLRAQLAEEKHPLVSARLTAAITAIEQRAGDEPPMSGRGPVSSRPPPSVRAALARGASAGVDSPGGGPSALDVPGEEEDGVAAGTPRRSAYRNLWLGALVGLPLAALLAFVLPRWGLSPDGPEPPAGSSAVAAPVLPSAVAPGPASAAVPAPSAAVPAPSRLAEPAASGVPSAAGSGAAAAPTSSAASAPRPGSTRPAPSKPQKPAPSATATTTTTTPFVLPFGKSQE